ncbi:MAG: SDR family oxidoreductase [Actinomycetota bacterium]
MSDGRFRDRAYVVTGGASGIGRATVERLVAEGAGVVAVDLDASRFDWADDLHAVEVVEGSVADEAVNAAAVDAATDRWGRLDGIVCNAGVTGTPPLDGDLAPFDRTMEINVRAVVLGIRAAVPQLRVSGGGSIVAIASTSGMRGDPAMWAYNASKGAVINLVRGMAVDLAHERIRVNAVCPGPTRTGMTTGLIEGAPAVGDAIVRRVPMQRWGESSELAAVVAFALSDDASFVTGAVIPVDGGVTASTGQFAPPGSEESLR